MMQLQGILIEAHSLRNASLRLVTIIMACEIWGKKCYKAEYQCLKRMTLKTSWGLKLMTICTTRFKSKVIFQCNWIECNFAELEAGLDVFFLDLAWVQFWLFKLIWLDNFNRLSLWICLTYRSQVQKQVLLLNTNCFFGKCCSFHFNINFNSSVKKSLWLLKSTCCFISGLFLLLPTGHLEYTIVSIFLILAQ